MGLNGRGINGCISSNRNSSICQGHPAVSPVFAMVSVCAIPFPEKDNKSSKLKKGITGLMPGICLLFI